MRYFRVFGPLLLSAFLFAVLGCAGGTVPTGTFTLSLTPSSLTVQAGNSAQITLLATAQGNYTKTVSLTATGLPSGVTISPASLTLTPGTPVTATLTAASTAQAGTGSVMFSAVGSTQSAALALTVSPPPTFSLGITSPSSSITAGAAGLPLSFSVQPANGFTGTVAVTLSGLGAGITAAPGLSFNLPTGSTQIVTLSAAASVAPTMFPLNIKAQATSGPATFETVLNLQVVAAPVPTGPDITTYHYDNARDGLNAQETILTPTNVSASTFGLRGVYPVDGKVDAQPLYAGGLKLGTGAAAHTDNVVYVVTEHDNVFALNAATGAQEWKASVLGSGEVPSDSRNCSQVQPEIGITSTPVMDRAYGPNGAIFVVAMSKDAGGGYHQRLHALDLATGAELPNSPTNIAATYPGTGEGSSQGVVAFDPGQYVARAGLLLMNGSVYIGWSSHCDIQPYTGWMMGYSEASLKQSTVLNLTPNGAEGSIWMSGFGLAADGAGNIFFADANGTLDPSFSANGFPSQNDFGNAIVKLSTTAGLTVNDFWEPWNTVAESNADVDLGSGGAMLLPDLTDSTGAVHHLVVVAGKDTNIYVADRDNLGKFAGGTSNSTLYQELSAALPNGEWAGPAYFNNTVFFGGVNDVLKAYTVSNAKLSAAPTSQSSAIFGYPGTTPSVSANGTQNAIVWALQSTENNPAVLHAYDPANLQHELYNSTQAANNRDAFGNGNKFITPVVSNGMVFIGTTNAVAVFGLLH